MIDLGTGPTPSALGAIELSSDELWFLQELLGLDPLPVVLSARPRYDNLDAQQQSRCDARSSLEGRKLLGGNVVHEELATWLQALAWPHWVVAVRLYTGETMSRLCLARSSSLWIRCLRGPRSQSYLFGAVGADNAVSSIVTMLPKVQSLDFTGLTAPTEQLQRVFGLLGDATSTARQLREIGVDTAAADAVGRATVEISARAEIVGVTYHNGNRNIAPCNIALFDTRDGRIVATSSIANDGTEWSSLSSGTVARLRHVLAELVSGLEDRRCREK